MKSFIIKTNENKFKTVHIDFFKNRLARQTFLDDMHKQNLFKNNNKKGLANFIKGIVSVPYDYQEIENALLKTVTDSNGFYLRDVAEEKRNLFWSNIYDKLKIN